MTPCAGPTAIEYAAFFIASGALIVSMFTLAFVLDRLGGL